MSVINHLFTVLANRFFHLEKKTSKYGAEFGTEYHVFGITIFKKNYSLNSGERQTGKTLVEIRQDHKNRYQFAIDQLMQTGKKPRKILDCFCGNGYGSYMLGQAFPDSTVLGIDGSREAIQLAEKHFKAGKNFFLHKVFPFYLGKEKYDAIVSLESIEHIQDDRSFLGELASHLEEDGLLFLSTPNSDVYPLAPTENAFHFKHYSLKDVQEMADRCGLEILERYSQNVYLLDEKRNTQGILPEDQMILKKDFDGQFDVFVLIHKHDCGRDRK